jgi:hypothetical protein
MKKNRGDEPVGVIIHIHIGISQGNFLCSYLYLKQAKMSFYFFLLQNQRTDGQNRSYLGGWYQREWRRSGERMWEGKYSANTMYISM